MITDPPDVKWRVNGVLPPRSLAQLKKTLKLLNLKPVRDPKKVVLL